MVTMVAAIRTDALVTVLGPPVCIESINAIRDAIDSMEDKDQKEYAREFLNNLIKQGKEDKKKEKKKKHQEEEK